LIYGSISDIVGRTPVVRLDRLFSGPHEVLAKLEFLNPLGSAKDRPAKYVIEHWLKDGTISPGSHLVESSSGNFAISLASLCPIYGLRLSCVVDPTISRINLAILRRLGANVEMVTDRDGNGGYLSTRLARVQEILRQTPGTVWINQYANDLCRQAHAETTAEEIIADVDVRVDVLVVAVSTSATLMGTAEPLRRRWPRLRVVAVDAVGSVVFGGPPAVRRLPGLGSSRRPELLDATVVDQVIYVAEDEAVAGCDTLLRTEGILAGASSGAVVAAVGRLTAGSHDPSRILTLLPDRGERYVDTETGRVA
jgi:2,3-diaminopropionate biosynthesis protein SbnA